MRVEEAIEIMKTVDKNKDWPLGFLEIKKNRIIAIWNKKEPPKESATPTDRSEG